MAFLTKLIPMKGWMLSIAGLALLASLSFGWMQTQRLESANASITSMASATTTLRERIDSDREIIESRDALIAKQNAGIQALVDAAATNRSIYLTGIAQADKVAKVHQSNAQAILARETAATDELGRAKAALQLITDTLRAERNTDASTPTGR